MISIAASYLIGIFCVLAWGWWLCRRLSLPNGFAPALGLCCAIAGLAAAGSCGLLGLGTQAFCLGAVLVTVRPKHGLIRGFLVSPGILAFVSGCLVSALLALFTAPSASAGNLTIQGALLFSGDGLSALDFLFGIWLPGKNAHSMPFTLTLLPLAAFSAVMALVKAEHFTRFFHRILAAVCGAAVGALLFWSSAGQKSFLPISTVWFSLVCLILLFCPGRVLGNFSPLQRAASHRRFRSRSGRAGACRPGCRHLDALPLADPGYPGRAPRYEIHPRFCLRFTAPCFALFVVSAGPPLCGCTRNVRSPAPTVRSVPATGAGLYKKAASPFCGDAAFFSLCDYLFCAARFLAMAARASLRDRLMRPCWSISVTMTKTGSPTATTSSTCSTRWSSSLEI